MRKSKARRISKKDSARIEHAIHFLSEKYRESGINAKPVVLHSLEIAFFLLRSGASADIVIIAILHDLIEDSQVNFTDIEKNFGKKIARGVLSLTEDKRIKKYETKYKENFARLLAEGEDMILVRMADMLHNSSYLRLEKDIKKQKLVLDKIGYFLRLVKTTKYQEMYAALEKRYEEEKGRMAK